MKAMPLGISPRQLGWTVFAGCLAAAAFPPISVYPLILVSMVIFLYQLRDLDQQTARNLGVVYGLTLGLGTMYWFFVVFTIKALDLSNGTLLCPVGSVRGHETRDACCLADSDHCHLCSGNRMAAR